MVGGEVKAGDLFFFYGLLKQGASGAPPELDLASAGVFLGEASVRGDMYDLGGFPGIVPGEGLCRGVLYCLGDASLAPRLDAFEDIDPRDPEGSLYRRERVQAIMGEASRAAWIYLYNQSLEGAPKMPDGNWPLDAGRRRK